MLNRECFAAICGCRFHCFFLIFVVGFFLSSVPPRPQETATFWQGGGGSQGIKPSAEELCAAMSDRQLVGQTLLFSFPGALPDRSFIERIERGELAGVKYFGWNVASLSSVAEGVNRLQRAAQRSLQQIPLLVATDQEGGWVRHIHRGASESGGNISISASGRHQDAYLTGYYIGRELRGLGINMNFAPTVDLFFPVTTSVIGPRAFSDDPHLTAELAFAYFRGLEANRVIATAKHYPGHGRAEVDSHGYLPQINIAFEQLWRQDLYPYRYLIKERLPAIMAGHLAFPQLTEQNIPSTLSSYLSTTLLRQRMEFDGVLVSDDMIMGGVQRQPGGSGELCRQALLAGVDLLIVSRDTARQQAVFDYLTAKMAEDRQFAARVRQAAIRVVRLKLRYLRDDNRVPLYPDRKSIERNVRTQNADAFFADQQIRAATVINARHLPLSDNGVGRLLLVSQYNAFFNAAAAVYPAGDRWQYSYYPFYQSTPQERETLRSLATAYDTIIFTLANPHGRQLLLELENSGSRVYVVSVLSPLLLADIDWPAAAIAVYGTTETAFTAALSIINGSYQAAGRIPLAPLRQR